MKIQTHKLRIGTLSALAFALCLAGGSGLAQAASSKAIEAGKKVFVQYCAACHGVDAKGNGPVASTLKNGAPDLTLIYKKNKGVFPFMMVVDVIEGGAPKTAHGTPEMPVWGFWFGEEGEAAKGRGWILDIVLYLNSIQSK